MSLSRKQVIISAIILAIIALLSPFFSITFVDRIETSILIQTLFFSFRTNIPGTPIIFLNDYWETIGYIPFVIFRLVVPMQFIRYYELKVTGYTLAITGLAGEIPPMLLIFSMPPTMYLSQIVCPLPFHLLICAMIIFLRPADLNSDAFDEYE
ncbi:hypothetical protein EU527_04565 [Candidatus Thorarchaeota archaeon]|nr:MAG: hypothetical protein EU527_04565 [Candidatus Thorarchaeota archaeon]